jgi:hypothetical protein
MDRKRHSVAIGMTTGMHSVVIGERHLERGTRREELKERQFERGTQRGTGNQKEAVQERQS